MDFKKFYFYVHVWQCFVHIAPVLFDNVTDQLQKNLHYPKIVINEFFPMGDATLKLVLIVIYHRDISEDWKSMSGGLY